MEELFKYLPLYFLIGFMAIAIPVTIASWILCPPVFPATPIRKTNKRKRKK